MGRHSRVMKMPTADVEVDWAPDEVGAAFESARSRRLGRHRTGLRVTEMRAKDELLELDYQFNTGGASLKGTMYLSYEKDEELGLLVDQLENLCKEAFHGVRRSRD